MSSLELDIKSFHVDSIQRINSDQVILVKMIRQIDQQTVIKTTKQKRLNTNDIKMTQSNNIYISETLTPKVSKVFVEARQFKKNFDIKFI